jgi:formamidopyrimidine-DNA glycosylase
MPELPEVEAWVRELDPLVSRSPILQAGPAHRDPEDVRPAAARARRAPVRRCAAPRQVALLPDEGRRAAAADPPDERRPDPSSRSGKEGSEDAGVPASLRGRRRAHPDRGGPKKRAGVWLETPEQTEAELAHIGPEALGLSAAQLREILAGVASGCTRSCATSGPSRESAARTRTRSSIARSSRRSRSRASWRGGDRPSCNRDRRGPDARARATRTGKRDKDVYLVHRRLGDPVHGAASRFARSTYEEHTVFYCASCQTGGRILKDRRMSRLLR